MSRVTVRHYIEADGFPERAPTKTRHSELEKYVPYLHQRFAAGCDNATQLWREVVARGHRGRVRMVRRYVWRLRARTKALSLKRQLRIQSTAVGFRIPSSRRAAWWLRRADELSADERLFVKQLIDLCPEIEKIKELAQSFREMVRRRASGRFNQWLRAAGQTKVAEFKSFAEGLRRDRAAVKAALDLPWSSGQVEGQINRLKMMKRQMYGRANVDLLRARVLQAA